MLTRERDWQVTPGMEVLTSNEVLPAMFQNKFVIVSGAGQIRLATYGFIGGPAVGDRPCVPMSVRSRIVWSCNAVKR
jgi:hypothetical protein